MSEYLDSFEEYKEWSVQRKGKGPFTYRQSYFYFCENCPFILIFSVPQPLLSCCRCYHEIVPSSKNPFKGELELKMQYFRYVYNELSIEFRVWDENSQPTRHKRSLLVLAKTNDFLLKQNIK